MLHDTVLGSDNEFLCITFLCIIHDLFDGVNILELEVDERARMGLFLAMQYPSEIPGITNAEFLRAAMNAGKEEDEKISIRDFIKKLDEKMELLNMKEEMAERYLNK